MLILTVSALIFCYTIVCWATKKIIKAILNLRALYLGKKHPYGQPRSAGMVYNKKTAKLEADNKQVLPFN